MTRSYAADDPSIAERIKQLADERMAVIAGCNCLPDPSTGVTNHGEVCPLWPGLPAATPPVPNGLACMIIDPIGTAAQLSRRALPRACDGGTLPGALTWIASPGKSDRSEKVQARVRLTSPEPSSEGGHITRHGGEPRTVHPSLSIRADRRRAVADAIEEGSAGR